MVIIPLSSLQWSCQRNLLNTHEFIITIKYFQYADNSIVLCSGHAKGLKPLNGDHLEFCDDTFRQIYNDPKVSHDNSIIVTCYSLLLTGKESEDFETTFG